MFLQDVPPYAYTIARTFLYNPKTENSCRFAAHTLRTEPNSRLVNLYIQGGKSAQPTLGSFVRYLIGLLQTT